MLWPLIDQPPQDKNGQITKHGLKETLQALAVIVHKLPWPNWQQLKSEAIS